MGKTMGKQRSSLRQVPWRSWEEWKWVATELFSDSAERISAALDRITAWQSRGKVPIAVEVSAALIGIHQRDLQFNHGNPKESAVPEELLRMMYAMAIQRLVNGVVDQSQKRNIASVANRAELAGLPRLLVDIRHEAAHNELPGLSLLQIASKQALAWLKLHYWDQQKETLVNARVKLKSKLVEHCLLVINILNPSTVAAELQQFNNEVMPNVKSDGLLIVQPRETMAVKQQQRTALFNELLDLSLSSTSDLLSVLVDDGLLEQDTLSTLDVQDGKQPLQTYSVESSDLASATDYAWKFTLRQLSSHLPQLPGLLLVAIINRIDLSCSQTVDPQSCWNNHAGSTMSHTSAINPRERTETVAIQSKRRNRLTLWCAWLLGKGSSQDLNSSTGQGPVNSKLQKMSKALLVRADLSKELLGELLRKCLRISSERGPVSELVSLIAMQLGGNRFQCLASALAQLGTGMQSVQSNLTNRQEGQVTGVLTVMEEGLHESSLKTVATASPTWEQEKSLGSRTTQGCSESFEDSWMVASESGLKVARRQQTAFLERLSSQRTASTASDNPCSGHFSSIDKLRILQTHPSTLNIPQVSPDRVLQSTSVGHRQDVREAGGWTVVESWQTCAIGMIPSPCNRIGMMSSLELVGDVHRGQLVGSKQPGGHLDQQTIAPHNAAQEVDNSLTSTDFILPVVSKRRHDQDLDASVSEKRPKKSGSQVRFPDVSPVHEVDKDTDSLCWASHEGGTLISHQAKSPHKEQVHRSSLIQGCLLQHGLLQHISPQELESIQSAVHAL